MQRKLTAAGFVAAVVDGDPYPAFPVGRKRLLDRIKWARDVPLRNAMAAKSVLLHLAVAANDAGKTWPLHETLANWSGMTDRSVRTALRKLEGQRWLVTVARDGGYSLYFPKSPTESVCTWCESRWAEPVRFCPNCGEQTNLFQPATPEEFSGLSQNG